MGNDVHQLSDGGYVVAGVSTMNPPADAIVMNLNNGGGLAWRRNSAKGFYDYGNALCITDAGNYIVCGSVKSIETGKNCSVSEPPIPIRVGN